MPFSTVLIVLRLTPTSSASAGLGEAALAARREQPVVEPLSHP